MGQTFLQMAEDAMQKADSVSAQEAIALRDQDPNTLLVDVRDEAEVQITGIGPQAVNAPGRSIAWMADTEPDNAWRDPDLQDRNRKILTTCGLSPCYRGAKAANLLTKMGFKDVAYVEGGMSALLAAGLKTQAPTKPSQSEDIGKAQI